MASTALAQLSQTDILIVEDNASDAFLVGNLLMNGGGSDYKTHAVTSESEAVAALAKQAFDVCLLDLTLPDTSGFSALINIQEKAPDMPVVVLTGMKDASLAKRAVRRGAQDYLLKDELEHDVLTRAIDYAMERKRVAKELFQRANYDALTSLANRDMFRARLAMALARAERSGHRVAVLFIDLDRFKTINDSFGHEAGDEALKTVAQRIKNALRAYDTPARFGGDEFAVLLETIQSPRDAANIARKIIQALAAPIPFHHHQLELGASMGIAFSEKGATADTLIQHADIAMYHAKKGSGSHYRFYVEKMHDEVARRLSLEEDLQAALAAEELQLYYQPYLGPDEKLLGVEALLRWKHPDRGTLPAHEFLFAAEEARLMPEISRWAAAQLRHDIALWNAHELPPLHIGINFSVSQLDTQDLTEWFSPLLEKNFLGDHRLAVEIPEAALTTLSAPRLKMLTGLHEMGVDLHLDHFGCNALPLAQLCTLPFSLLKIDRSLIRTIGEQDTDNVLVSTAILLAHHLGIKAAAVGVETQWQKNMLKEKVCDALQGYLTTEPMTAGKLVEWVAA